MATIISNGNTNLSTASGFYRVEADNLCAISTTLLGLTTTRYINFTPANAVTGLGAGLWLGNVSAMTDRQVIVSLEEYQSVTSFNTTTEKVNKVAHGLLDLDIVSFSTTGVLPTGITAGVQYYVRNKSNDDFQLSSTPTGSIIGLSGTPSGTWQVGVQRATKTLEATDIASSAATGTYAKRGTFITPFTFTAGYSVTTDANKWRLRVGHGTGTGTWNLYTSDATNPFYFFWGNGAVSFNNNDTLIVKDYVTIDQSATLNGKLGTGEAVTGCAAVICSNPANPLPADVAYLKWEATPASAYTLTVNGKIYIARFSGFRVGTSTDRIPAAQKATITFGAPTVGTATSGFMGANTSTTYEYGGGASLFLYGEIPTYSHTHLASDANTGQAHLLTTDNVDWVNGDTVVVGRQNVQGQGDTALYTVSSVAGNDITLTGNLATNNRLAGGSVIKLGGYGIRIQAAGTQYIYTPLSFEISGVEMTQIIFSMVSTTYYYFNTSLSTSYKAQYLVQDCVCWGTSTTFYYNFVIQIPPENFLVQRVYSHRSIPVYTVTSFFGLGYNSGRLTVRDCIAQSAYAGGINAAGSINNRFTMRDCIFENGRASGSFAYMQGINVEFYNNTFWGHASSASTATTNGAVNVSQCINPIQIGGNIYDNNLVAMGFSGATTVACVDIDSTFGTSTANTTDIAFLSGAFSDYIFKSQTGSLVLDLTYLPDMVLGGRIGFESYNDTAKDDKMIYTYGKTQRTNASLSDTTVHTAGGSAFRFEPLSSTESFTFDFDVPTGDIQNKTMMVGVWCKINSATYYAGTHAMPRLTVTYDGTSTVYAEAAIIAGDWQFLFVPITPLTTTGSINVELSCMTDATTTDAYVYFDDFSILYPAGYIMNLSGLDDWDLGLPVLPPISTLFSAQDVWAVATSTLTGAGTVGKQVGDIKKDTGLIPALL